MKLTNFTEIISVNKNESIYHLKIFFVGYEFNISEPLYKPNFVRINFESLVLILLDLAGLGRSGRWALVAFRSISSPTSSLNLFFSHRTLFMFSNLSFNFSLKKNKIRRLDLRHVIGSQRGNRKFQAKHFCIFLNFFMEADLLSRNRCKW